MLCTGYSAGERAAVAVDAVTSTAVETDAVTSTAADAMSESTSTTAGAGITSR
jgi:hypothetical protein